MARLIRKTTGVAAFLASWEVFGRWGVMPKSFFPPPSTVAGTLAHMFGTAEFVRALIASILCWLIAFAISVIIAVPVGLLLGNVRTVRLATRTLIEFLRPIPAVALVPLALVSIGGGPASKIALAVYAAIWPILFNVVYALGQVDPQYVDTARSFGLGRVQIALRVRLPDVTPFALTGVRLSATIALLVVVSVELMGGGSVGLGTYVMSNGEVSGRMDIVLAGAVVAGSIGVLTNLAIVGAQRRWVPWATTEASGE
jgi:NitT/TauT family transport system permease protein